MNKKPMKPASVKRSPVTALFSFITMVIAGVIAAAPVTAAVVSHQLDKAVSFQAVTWQNNMAVASGSAGGIYLSEDNGKHWNKVEGPARSVFLQFRDNQFLDNGRLIVMSAGEGKDSGIFISDDQGKSWQQTSEGQAASTFYDCFAMTDDSHGWLYGDSDDQGLFVLFTEDGGDSWQRQKLNIDAQKSEGGFASSGTCLNYYNENGIIIGTGNGEQSRLLILENDEWRSLTTPIPGGEAGGVFTVQVNGKAIFIAGGSLKSADKKAEAWLYHTGSGKWVALPPLPLRNAIYGSALLPTPEGLEYWVSNPDGVAVLKPDSSEWQLISESNIWSLACQQGKGCIGAGKDGLIEVY